MLPINLTGSAIGIIMKEAVRRAVKTIRNERFVFNAKTKEGYDGNMDDVLTSADLAAQEVYLQIFDECFPGVGVIGEENQLMKPCTIPHFNAYFTIGPLDGTKAFVREQSQGVSSMISLVVNGKIVSAWIGDINTEELYGYRPDSDKVHRIDQYEASRYLHTRKRVHKTENVYVLAREYPDKYDEDLPARWLVQRSAKCLVDGSSIGTWMARLWKGEVDVGLIDPGFETPWDSTPIIGISQKLGFVFFEGSSGCWQECQPKLVTEPEERKYWLAVVHKENAHLLAA